MCRQLAQEIGERNVAKPWELASAADFLVEHMEGRGLQVERRGFELDGGNVMAQNLSVSFAGNVQEGDWVVVGAAYDSALGGADVLADAVGVAATIELARTFQSERYGRSMRFVWFGSREAGSGDTGSLGGAHCSAQMEAAKEHVFAMVELGRVDVGRARGPDRWELLVDSEPGSEGLGETIDRNLRTQLGPSLALRHRAGSPTGTRAARAFSTRGIPAVSLSVASHAKTAPRSCDEVDFDMTARVVVALAGALRGLGAGDARESAEVSTPRGTSATVGVDWTADSLVEPEGSQ